MVNTNGREGVNEIAKRTEDESITFFSKYLGWRLLYKRVDLKFESLYSRIENRGIDSLFYVNNPLNFSEKEGIIVDAKHVKDKTTFSSSRLLEDIDVLKYKLSKINNSKTVLSDTKIVENRVKNFRYGILFYRWDKFDKEKLLSAYDKIDITETSTNPNTFPIIMIVSNHIFSKFIHLKNLMGGKQIDYIYPNYLNNRAWKTEQYINVNYLMSDIIMFKSNGKNYVLYLAEYDDLTLKFIKDFTARFQHNVDYIIFANAKNNDQRLYEQKSTGYFPNDVKIVCLNSDENVNQYIGDV